jgi:hypothetical protein
METYHLTSAQDNVTGVYRQVAYIQVVDEAARMNQIWLLAFIVAITSERPIEDEDHDLFHDAAIQETKCPSSNQGGAGQAVERSCL